MPKKITFKSGLFVLAFLLLSCLQADAFTMSGTFYKIRLGNFNSSSGKPTGPNNKLSFTSGETAPGLFSGTNYKVRSGFQYYYSIIPFRFAISSTSISFGTLTATNPVTRTNTLTISNGSAFGYAIQAYENHQLLDPGHGQVIPDTTCDNGSCSETTAATWNTVLTYGFGYRFDI